MLLKGGFVHTPEGFIRADILVRGEFIEAIAPHLTGESVLDCSGLYVIPGLIDAHVHFREPGATHKEDFYTGSRAAAAGGVTTVLDMPNNIPPTTTEERLAAKRRLAAKSIVNYGFYGLGCRESKGTLPGVAGSKVYLGSSTGNYLTDDLGVFADILQQAVRPVVVHAEQEQLIRHFSEKNAGTGHYHLMRDNLCALTGVAEAVVMAEYFGKKLHLAHVSTKEEIAFLQRHKTKDITCEVAPHHLFLTEQFFVQHGALGKMNPPLRFREDQQALWQGIRNGLVDIIATDHAPHTKEEKEQDNVPCGVPGVQTMLALLLDAVYEGKLTLLDVVRLTSANPSRIFGIQRRGLLLPGWYADICVVDTGKEEIITNEQQFSKCGWTPFAGKKVRGWPVTTMVNGTVVYHNGKFPAEKKGKEVVYDV